MDYSATGQLFFSNQYVQISVLSHLKTVQLTWDGYVAGDDYRTALLAGLEAVQTHGLTGWLADLSNMGLIKEEDENWTNAVFFPQLVGSTVEKMAIIVSSDVFNQLSVEQIMSRVEGANFAFQYFDTMTAAVQWLLE